MKNASVKKIHTTQMIANDNETTIVDEVVMLEEYRSIARQAHAACTSVDMDVFEKKYGFGSFV